MVVNSTMFLHSCDRALLDGTCMKYKVKYKITYFGKHTCRNMIRAASSLSNWGSPNHQTIVSSESGLITNYSKDHHGGQLSMLWTYPGDGMHASTNYMENDGIQTDQTNTCKPLQGGELAMDAGDWRSKLQAGTRQRIVNKLLDTLKRHLPGQKELYEVMKVAVRFEEKIYSAATSQTDYL